MNLAIISRCLPYVIIGAGTAWVAAEGVELERKIVLSIVAGATAWRAFVDQSLTRNKQDEKTTPTPSAN
jgi:hypothetical protein